jgi:hypothetical protein
MGCVLRPAIPGQEEHLSRLVLAHADLFHGMNPGLSSRHSKPQPFIGAVVPVPLVNHYPFLPDNSFKAELNQQLERIRPGGR